MKIKWNKCISTNEYDSVFEYVSEDSFKLDDELYEFPKDCVAWDQPQLLESTGYAIIEAARVDGELYITARRYCGDWQAVPDWDTKDYQEVTP